MILYFYKVYMINIADIIRNNCANFSCGKRQNSKKSCLDLFLYLL